MVKIFALALHLEENYFDRYIDKPAAAMRITHYPQQDVCRLIKELYCVVT
jgi:isopenicillin N synthase-like dioxygenase